MQTALDERNAQFERTPAGLNAYPEVDTPVPDADVDVWNFESAHVTLIDATNVVLDGVDLVGEDFGRFDFASSSFRHCNANRARWSGADLSEANFFGAKLHGAFFGNTRLAGAQFDSADLRGAVFNEVDFTYIDLLTAASLRGTRIVGTKGLTEDVIIELRQRGAIVTDIGDYQSADDLTSPGDDPAPSPDETD